MTRLTFFVIIILTLILVGCGKSPVETQQAELQNDQGVNNLAELNFKIVSLEEYEKYNISIPNPPESANNKVVAAFNNIFLTDNYWFNHGPYGGQKRVTAIANSLSSENIDNIAVSQYIYRDDTLVSSYGLSRSNDDEVLMSKSFIYPTDIYYSWRQESSHTYTDSDFEPNNPIQNYHTCYDNY